MAASTLSRRRATAHAEARAAKERKQKIILVGGVVLLALLLVWELPKVLKSSGSSNTTSTPAAPAAAPAATGAASTSSTLSPAQLKADRAVIRRLSPHDPFAQVLAAGGTPSFSDVGPPAGVRDPFVNTSAPAVTSTPQVVSTPAPSTPLPARLIVGTPGTGKVAQSGWIVILASIPTNEGRSSAASFAARASKSVGPLSILNSSNTRPLRGGYWVVYSGPYATLAKVSDRATSIHQSGYGSAYVRQLIVYIARSR